MSVIDRRATCTLSFEINPALGKMLSELPKKSWTSNATKAVSLPLQAVPLLDGTLITKDPSMGAITTEATLRVLLSVQHHREGLKAPLREARQGASSGSEQVLNMMATFADNMISTSPLASVPTPLRELAISMYEALVAKLDAAAEDTPSRSTAWKNFLKLLPAAYALPLATAAKRDEWRNRIVIFPNGTVHECATLHDYIATALSTACTPVLMPALFADWISINRSDMVSSYHKQHPMIRDFMGFSADDEPIALTNRGAWRGHDDTMSAVTDSDDDDSKTHDNKATNTDSDATDSEVEASQSDTVHRDGYVWHRLRAITNQRLSGRGWWRPVSDNERFSGQHFFVTDEESKMSFIRFDGDGASLGIANVDAAPQPANPAAKPKQADGRADDPNDSDAPSAAATNNADIPNDLGGQRKKGRSATRRSRRVQHARNISNVYHYAFEESKVYHLAW